MDWVTDPGSGLQLPRARPLAHAWLMRSVRVPARWIDVAAPGGGTTPDILLDLIQRLPLEGTLRLCSALQMFLHSQPGTDDPGRRQQQVGLLRELFPLLLRRDLESRLRQDPNAVVFHEEQLLYLTYLALLWAPVDDRTLNSITLAELLLRINDTLAPNTAASPDSTVSTLLRRSGALSQEHFLQVLGRYYDVLFNRARLSPDPSFNFEDSFLQATEISLNKYLWIVSAYNAFFLRVRTPADLRNIQFDRIIQSINAGASVENLGARASALVTAEAHWYRGQFGSAAVPRGATHLNYGSFYERPSEAILPIQPDLGLYRLSLGLYWTLFTHYQGLGARWLEAYTARVGTLFQSYISDALQLSVDDSEATPVALERDMERHNLSVPCPDIVMVDGSTWVVIEVAAASITMETLVQGDVPAFRRELREKFQWKLRQPVRGLEAVLSAIVTHPQLDISEVVEVFPVVVTLQPLSFPGIQAELDAVAGQQTLVTRGAGVDVSINAVQLISAEEVELMTPLLSAGRSLVDILKQKSENDPTGAVSLKNSLIYSGVLDGYTNEWAERLVQNVQQTTLAGGPPGEAEPAAKGT